ncbi:MAG: AAA family ATPase [Candidatus Nealsonbacteria bacterium]|nr:AAA family ATPase [Candidatus Nealsonbacteria bacterium]
MTTSKQLIVVAGPNGSGKTTFALEYLAERAYVYLSADAIAEGLSPDAPERKQFAAGRQFLAALEEGLASDESLLVESTLSGRRFSRVLEAARATGFSTSIVMLFLNSPETCVGRVQQRVRKGGHHVPEVDIRRRFSRSLYNFWSSYRFLADHWALMYNANGGFESVAAGTGKKVSTHNERLFDEFLVMAQRNRQ